MDLPAIRTEAMADARRLRWHKLSGDGAHGLIIRLERIYIGARYNEEEQVWMLGRVRWCEHCEQFEVASGKTIHISGHEQAFITHFADDILGTPY